MKEFEEDKYNVPELNIPKVYQIAIPALPEPYRSVMKMKLERYTYKEIAKEIGISVNYAYACVCRAKKKIKILESKLKHFEGNKKELEKLIIDWIRIGIEK